MIVHEDFLKKLRAAFDLNIYEVKVWTALLSRGLATAGELSDISNVPRSRSYDVLESLEKKGFVIMKLGKPIKYIAVEPKEVIKRVKKVIQKHSEKQVESLENIKSSELYTEIQSLFKKGIDRVDPATIAGSLRGRDAIYSQMDSIISNAQKSVILATSAEGFQRKINYLGKALEKASKNKVQVRIATELTEENKKLVKKLNGIKVKDIKDLNARFCIVDGKDVLFAVTNDKDMHENYDIAIWANTPFFANTLESLFNVAWSKAK